MKTKQTLFVLAAVVALLAWKFLPTEAAPPVVPAPKPTLLQTVVAPKPAQVEAPKAAPATPKASPVSPLPSFTDPHTDLQTLIPKLADLLAAHDFAGYLKMVWPTDKLDYEMRYANTPSVEKLAVIYFGNVDSLEAVTIRKTSSLVGALRSIQDQTPVFGVDDSGVPTATYKIDYSLYGRYTVQFKQVNGLWFYIDLL